MAKLERSPLPSVSEISLLGLSRPRRFRGVSEVFLWCLHGVSEVSPVCF